MELMEAALGEEHLHFVLLLVLVSDWAHAVDASGDVEC